MVQAHLDESHFGHAKAKSGEPWTSTEMILKREEEEKEKELKEADSEEEEESEEDEDVSDAERGTHYHSAKRTTRGHFNNTILPLKFINCFFHSGGI